MDLLEKWQQEAGQGAGIRLAFAASQGVTAQKAARAALLAEALGTTPQAVLQDPSLAEREHIARQVEQSPRLAQWAALEQGANAPFVYEDAKGLAGVFDYVPNLGVAKSLLKSAGKLPGQAAQTVYNAAGLGLGALDYLEEGAARTLKFTGLTGGQRTGWFGAARDWAQGNAEAIRKGYLESWLLTLPEEKQGRLWDNPALLLDPEYLTYQLGEAAGSVAISLAGGAGYSLAKGGALSAEALAEAGAVIGGLMEGGSLYGDLLKEGLSNERALAGSISFGALVGLLEKVGLDKMLEGPGGKGLAQAIGKRLTAGVAESVTEYAEEPAQAIITGLSRGDGPATVLSDFFASLTNVDVIPGAFLLGGGLKHISDYARQGAQAREYAQDLMALYDKIEAAGTKQLSPAHMQSALEFSGEAMREQAALPADAALELYQKGLDLLSPLGITEEQAIKAAAQGQDFLVPVAKLQAYLDRQQMEAAARIIRRRPEAMSAADAARLEEKTATDAVRIVELYQAQAAELEEMGREKETLRREATTAIRGVPGLASQAESLAGGVDRYVDDWLNIIERYALRMTAAGQSPAETFRRIAFTSLRQSRPVTEAIAEDLKALQPEAGKPASDLRHLNVNTMDDVYGLAGQTEGQFYSDVEGWAGELGEEAIFRTDPATGQRALKNRARAERKLLGDKGGPAEIVDILGGTILFDTREQVEAAGEANRVGAITPEIAAKTGLRPGALVLDDAALQHIEEKHGAQIRALGYADARAFVADVLANVDAVYQGENSRVFEFVTHKTRPQSRALARLSFEEKGDKYEIKTAEPVRKNYYKKRTPLWEGAHSAPFVPNEDNPIKASRRASPGQSEERLNLTASAGNVKPGQTLNSGSAKNARGSVKIYPEGYLINLFQNADLSTLLHETGHIFFEEMERAVEAGAADQTMAADFATLRAWLGAEPGAALSVEQREKLARGFEAYLMEGKAPSQELEGAFARFRRWMMKIYQSASRLKVELTDEVRGVFERMQATEREIAVTAARNELLDLTARELDALGMTGAARNTLAGLMPKGRERAAEALQRARDENRRERLARYAAEAREELKKEPVYQARADMRKTPLDLQAVKDNYGEEAAQTLLKKAPGGLRNEGGANPDIMAAEHGFASGAEMIARLMDAPSLGEAVKARVAEKEARHDAAYEALEHLLETKEVALQMDMVGRKLAELTGAAHIEREAYTRAAAAELAAMPLGRAMQTGTFLAALRRALAQYHRALLSGDRAAALTAQRKALLNMEFVRESRELARRQGVTERQIRRFVGMAKGDPEARYIVMDIGMRHGLVKPNAQLAEGRDSSTIRDWIAAAAADGYGIFADDRVLFGPGKPWREMTVAEFETLAETVNQIVTVERGRGQVEIAGRKAELVGAAREIAARLVSVHRVNGVNGEKRQDPAAEDKKPFAGLDLSRFSLIRTEILFMQLDGGEEGPLWQVYKRVADAEDQRALRMKAEKARLDKLYALYSPREHARLMAEKFIIKSLGGAVISRENMLAVVLNLGNEISRQRLLEAALPDGTRLSQAAVAEIMGRMTEQDCAFVNAVWAYLDSFRAAAFALEERVNGLRPQAVEALPFVLRTAEGKSVAMRGGWYPIAYEPKKGARAQSLNEKDVPEALFAPGFGVCAQTKQGHSRARQAQGPGAPLRFRLSVLDEHVYNVVNDLAMREAAMDASRLLRHKEVGSALAQVAGTQGRKAIMSWLRDAAGERPFTGDFIDSALHWLRNGLAFMGLGFKAGTGLLQFTGLSVAVSRLGLKWTARGLRAVYGNAVQVNPFTAARRLLEVYQEVSAKSPFMATRLKAWSREVKDVSQSVKRGGGALRWTREHAFDLIGLARMGVDLPTWMGAYERELEKMTRAARGGARIKFDALRATRISGKEMGKIPSFRKISEIKYFVAEWLKHQTEFFRDDYSNADTGWNNIALTAKGIDNSLAHSAGPQKIQTIPALPEVIKNGVYLESTPAHNEKQQGMTNHIFAVKVYIGGKKMAVGFVIKEDANGKRFYDHELTAIESLDGVGPTNPALSSDEEKAFRFRQGSVMNIVRKHLSVKPGDIDESRAIAAADRMVRLTQGSGKTSDLSAVQRGGELQKTVTTFYSWFNALYNLASLTKGEAASAWAAGDKKEAARKAGAFLFWAWFGSQAMEIALDALRGQGPEEDEGEREWGKYLGGKFAGFWAGMLPLGRDMFDAALRGRKVFFSNGSNSSQGTQGIMEMGGLPGRVIDLLRGKEEAGKRAALSAMRSAGYALRLPAAPAVQILESVWDYLDGTRPELEIRKAILR